MFLTVPPLLLTLAAREMGDSGNTLFLIFESPDICAPTSIDRYCKLAPFRLLSSSKVCMPDRRPGEQSSLQQDPGQVLGDAGKVSGPPGHAGPCLDRPS